MHTALHQVKKSKPVLKFYPVEPSFGDWRDNVIHWWNDFVRNGWSFKTPALYLYGSSNTGKTHFAKMLLGQFYASISRSILFSERARLTF